MTVSIENPKTIYYENKITRSSAKTLMEIHKGIACTVAKTKDYWEVQIFLDGDLTLSTKKIFQNKQFTHIIS